MAQMEDKFRKQLEVAKLKLDEIEEILASGNAEDVSGAYEQIGELIKHLEKSKDVTADYLMETDKDLEYIKQWTMDHKEDISPFRKIFTRKSHLRLSCTKPFNYSMRFLWYPEYNQGWGKGYQLKQVWGKVYQPKLRLITLIKTLIILDITKTKSNNCLLSVNAMFSSIICYFSVPIIRKLANVGKTMLDTHSIDLSLWTLFSCYCQPLENLFVGLYL